jgi:hypothetical protein
MEIEFSRLSALYAESPRQHMQEFAQLLVGVMLPGIKDEAFDRFPVAVQLHALRKCRDQVRAQMCGVDEDDIDRWIATVELKYRDKKLLEMPEDAERKALMEKWLGACCDSFVRIIAKNAPDSVEMLCKVMDCMYEPTMQLRLLDHSRRELESLLPFIPTTAKFEELLAYVRLTITPNESVLETIAGQLRGALCGMDELPEDILSEYPFAIQYHVLGVRQYSLATLIPVQHIRAKVAGLKDELGLDTEKQVKQKLLKALRRMKSANPLIRKAVKSLPKKIKQMGV